MISEYDILATLKVFFLPPLYEICHYLSFRCFGFDSSLSLVVSQCRGVDTCQSLSVFPLRNIFCIYRTEQGQIVYITAKQVDTALSRTLSFRYVTSSVYTVQDQDRLFIRQCNSSGHSSQLISVYMLRYTVCPYKREKDKSLQNSPVQRWTLLSVALCLSTLSELLTFILYII